MSELYRDLSPSMQSLEQQRLSIFLHIAECLGLRFKLLPEGSASLLFLAQPLIQSVLQARIRKLRNRTSRPARLDNDTTLASCMQSLPRSVKNPPLFMKPLKIPYWRDTCSLIQA